MIADYVYAQDNQSTLARMYGAALTTGSTVEDVQARPERLRAVTRRAGARRRAALSRQAPLGHRLSRPRRRTARGEEIVIRLRCALAAALTLAFVGAAPAASKIEPIVSPGGIKAWLVREQAVPMVALDYAFLGGANADPADKPGVANMVGSLLDEGRGRARRARVPGADGGEGDPARLHGRRAISSAAPCVRSSANLDDAVSLLRLALTAPRFDAEPVELHPQPDAGQSEPRHHQPERDREPALVGDGVSRTTPMAALERHAGIDRRDHGRTISRPMCATCSRATR